MPKVSIIIPVYKVEKYLSDCLDSVLSQTFQDWKAICVNDGSPDKCGEILAKYAKKDKRIKVIAQANQGLSRKEIGSLLGVHPISVYNKIRKMKLVRPQKNAEYSSTFKGRDTELLKLRSSGKTLKEIGEFFGVRSNTVLYRLRKLEGANA